MRRLVLLGLLAAVAFLGRASANQGMMNVGTMMSPTNGAGGAAETFHITTLSGQPITTLGGTFIDTQQP
jgi:hypothetical protein